MKPTLLLLLLVLAGNLFAQRKKPTKLPHGDLVLHLNLLDEKVAYARGYAEERSKIEVKAHLLMYRDFEWKRVQTFNMPYDSLNDCWYRHIPYGTYEIAAYHMGFEYVECLGYVDKPDTVHVNGLLKANVPYSYDKGGMYHYIKGNLMFSETMIVQFAGGDPIENLAFLQTFPHERIQQLRDPRYFYFTAAVGSGDTISEMLHRQKIGRKAPEFGYLIGDSLNVLIDSMRTNANVAQVLPTFFKSDKGFLKPQHYAPSKRLKERVRLDMLNGIAIHPALLRALQTESPEEEDEKPQRPQVRLDENGEPVPESEE